MLRFNFDADAYRASVQHELIPEGQYRARITGVNVTNQDDGTDILRLDLITTYKNLGFRENIFLNPAGHPYFNSSNKRFGDLCNSCRIPAEKVKTEGESALIGCTCGIELAHKKSKDGTGEYNSVKKFLRPDETERLKEFADNNSPSGNAAFDPNTARLDPDDPSSWFAGH